jgi:hypothetical protein
MFGTTGARVKPMPGNPMPSVVLAAESFYRLSWFFGMLALMTLWEVFTPRRPQSIGRLLRWPNNFGLAVLNTILVRLLFPFAGVGILFRPDKGPGALQYCPSHCLAWRSQVQCCCSIWRSMTVT